MLRVVWCAHTIFTPDVFVNFEGHYGFLINLWVQVFVYEALMKNILMCYLDICWNMDYIEGFIFQIGNSDVYFFQPDLRMRSDTHFPDCEFLTSSYFLWKDTKVEFTDNNCYLYENILHFYACKFYVFL